MFLSAFCLPSGIVDSLCLVYTRVLLAHSDPFFLIYLSEVVFRDVPCHSSARPIKHTVMTDWPRSKLITDWLTERVALFCSAVLTPVCQTFQTQETLNAAVSFLAPLLSASRSRSHEYGFCLFFQRAHTDDEV